MAFDEVLYLTRSSPVLLTWSGTTDTSRVAGMQATKRLRQRMARETAAGTPSEKEEEAEEGEEEEDSSEEEDYFSAELSDSSAVEVADEHERSVSSMGPQLFDEDEDGSDEAESRDMWLQSAIEASTNTQQAARLDISAMRERFMT